MKAFFSLIIIVFSTNVFIGQIPPTYYDGADGLSGVELKTALYNIIKGHIEYPYTDEETDVWDILKETDRDPNNPDNVIFLTGVRR